MERPGEIDGDPASVQHKTIENLHTKTADLRLYIEESNVQFRNSYMSRRLKEKASLSPSELARLWHDSDANAGCERLLTLVGVIEQAIVSMKEVE